jgi:hypothetical protein
MDDATPQTEPSGALVPPRKPPSTALATASPAPTPLRPERQPYMREQRLRHLIAEALDAVDDLADTVAQGLGLRRT